MNEAASEHKKRASEATSSGFSCIAAVGSQGGQSPYKENRYDLPQVLAYKTMRLLIKLFKVVYYPDYSAAYCILETDVGVEGYGLAFTLVRGTELCVNKREDRHEVFGTGFSLVDYCCHTDIRHRKSFPFAHPIVDQR